MTSVPQTTDLEGTLAEFHEFFDKCILYMDPQDVRGTPLSSCELVQDKPMSFIRLTHSQTNEIRYVGAVLRDGQHGGRVEIYRVRGEESYEIALVKQGHVIDETGKVMSLMELAQHPGYIVNKGD